MYKLVRIFSLFVFLMGSQAFAAEAGKTGDNKVGYFDMQRAITSTEVGKKAKSDLDVAYAAIKKTLDKKKADIEKMGQDLEKKKAVLSEEVFAKKQAELQEEMGKFQNEVMKNQNEMQKKQAELLQPIVEKMQKVVAQIAGDKGYSMVLEKSERNVFFAQKEVDLTDDIVKAVNQGK